MATAFRQEIRPGQVGSDVRAVKRALRKMQVVGYTTLTVDNSAGPAFVKAIKDLQKKHGLTVDGVYGPKTHAIVAPHFDLYGVALYKAAKIRKPPLPPQPTPNAQADAQKLLDYHAQGKYIARNAGDLRDIEATASGKAVWSQGGYWVHIDWRVMGLLVWLIESGHKIGTYAICSDHRNDGPHGHAGGLATDIEWIDGTPVGSSSARANTLAMAKFLHQAPTALRLRQQICGGYDYRRDSDISACSVPGADSYYGSTTMAEHCNHIHAGF